MDSFSDWNQNKLYIDHINRLRVISKRSSSSNLPYRNKSKSSTKFRNLYQDSQKYAVQTPRRSPNKIIQRYDTQPIIKRFQTLRSPIPLVTQDQGKLIKSTLNYPNISLKQKQRLLQNYLLSKRILQTKAVINPSNFKKSFRLHKKTLENMSRPKSKNSLSQQRIQSFRKYQTQRQQQNQIQVGEGRNSFQMRIKQILLIKGIIVKNPHVLYNLKIYVGKSQYQLRALNYDNLFHQFIKINFKKSLLVNNPHISILITVLRQNHEQQLGVFKPIIRNFQNKQSQIYKVMKGKFPVGTIDIQGKTPLMKRRRTQLLKQKQ